jgi:hypothetical protein
MAAGMVGLSMADSSRKFNKEAPGQGRLRMRWHHGGVNRQVEIGHGTSSYAEK